MLSNTPSTKQKKLAELLQSKDGYKLLKQKDTSVIVLVKGKTRIKIK